MRLGRRLSSGIAEDPPRVEEPREAPVVATRETPRDEAPQPVAVAAER